MIIIVICDGLILDVYLVANYYAVYIFILRFSPHLHHRKHLAIEIKNNNQAALTSDGCNIVEATHECSLILNYIAKSFNSFVSTLM